MSLTNICGEKSIRVNMLACWVKLGLAFLRLSLAKIFSLVTFGFSSWYSIVAANIFHITSYALSAYLNTYFRYSR